MLAVGPRALLVAVLGVVAPTLLGFGVGRLARPGESWMLHAFLGALLCATSVGITARVLADARAIRTPAARIILGAAVIDDVLGLIVLALISGVITAAAAGDSLDTGALVLICAKAAGFLLGALVLGSLLSRRVIRAALAVSSVGLVQALSVAFCFALAWLAHLAGLAPIVGAFAAGLVLEEVHFEEHVSRGDRPLHRSLEPIVAFLVPLFFVRMGLSVDLSSFADRSVLALAALLTLAAILGKLVCGLGAPAGVSRLVVGLGMLPRGEVGLIFAGIGARLLVDGKPVIDSGTYAAAVFMVLATTIVTPPLLLRALRRSGGPPPGS
jgi:Kef-type K+ transport system membrane component KefB